MGTGLIVLGLIFFFAKKVYDWLNDRAEKRESRRGRLRKRNRL